jgi:hypothetical protein
VDSLAIKGEDIEVEMGIGDLGSATDVISGDAATDSVICVAGGGDNSELSEEAGLGEPDFKTGSIDNFTGTKSAAKLASGESSLTSKSYT